jgi:acetolactate decarboxylase
MKKAFFVLPVFAAVLLGGCATVPRDTLYQTSTIDALLAGVYDGDLACRELLRHGDFGIGTFDRLDGEMIVLDGTVRRIRSDGRAEIPNLGTTTPFAAVCRFTPERTLLLDAPLDLAGLARRLDLAAPNSNRFCAIRVEGLFRVMKTRSVPAQEKPYPPLKAVTAHQPEFTMTNVAGTVLGFRCPPFVAGVNVPGYHLHFLSADQTRGGHILAFELERGTAALDLLDALFLRLPADGTGFAGADLAKDRSGELKSVEK